MTKRMTDDDIVIRKARESDLPVLVGFLAKLALHVSGGSNHILKEEEEQRLTEVLHSCLADTNKHLIVATLESVTVGMGYLYISHSQGIWEQADEVVYRTGFIDDIWVEPEYRNQGVFRHIIRELVSFAERHHVQELILEYAISNKEAKAVWTRLGFQPTGVRAAAFTQTVANALTAQS